VGQHGEQAQRRGSLLHAAILAAAVGLAAPAPEAGATSPPAAPIAGLAPAVARTTDAAPPPSPASFERAADSPQRLRERAALVLDVARYVEWPPAMRPGPAAPFVVGVLGDEPMRAALAEELAGKRLGDRPIAVRGFRNLDEVDPCPVLVVGRAKARLLPVILEFLGESAVLTVGEREDFLELGGAVRLVEEPRRIAFEVNLAAADRRGLRLSAPVLQHALRVVGAAEREGGR
jgi:hypothetical protein